MLPYVEPELPGAPRNFIRLQLKAAARKFFDETEAWQVEQQDISLFADQASYELDPTTLRPRPEVRRIVWAMVDGYVIDSNEYELEPTPGDAPPFFQLTFNENRIPTKDHPDSLNVRVVLVPSPLTEFVPEYELNKYMEGIRSCLMHAMTSMTNTKWYSATQAERYRRLLHKEYNSAKREKLTNFKSQAVRSQGYDWI